MSKNQFGGSWTEAKMEIVVSYAKAYLTIMNKQSWAKTIYFDGFAGSGIIETNEKDEIKKGTALRILDITEPTSFDMYYFVELDENHKNELEKRASQYILVEKMFLKLTSSLLIVKLLPKLLQLPLPPALPFSLSKRMNAFVSTAWIALPL